MSHLIIHFDSLIIIDISDTLIGVVNRDIKVSCTIPQVVILIDVLLREGVRVHGTLLACIDWDVCNHLATNADLLLEVITEATYHLVLLSLVDVGYLLSQSEGGLVRCLLLVLVFILLGD